MMQSMIASPPGNMQRVQSIFGVAGVGADPQPFKFAPR
jgi:hypothetical protein